MNSALGGHCIQASLAIHFLEDSIPSVVGLLQDDHVLHRRSHDDLGIVSRNSASGVGRNLLARPEARTGSTVRNVVPIRTRGIRRDGPERSMGIRSSGPAKPKSWFTESSWSKNWGDH